MKYITFLCFRVKNWALKFGVDLWEFGRHFTKMNQIQNVSKRIFTLAFERSVWYSFRFRSEARGNTGPIGRTRCYKNATREFAPPASPLLPAGRSPATQLRHRGWGSIRHCWNTLAVLPSTLTTTIIITNGLRSMKLIYGIMPLRFHDLEKLSMFLK